LNSAQLPEIVENSAGVLFDPHRPYQNSPIQKHSALRFCTNWHTCTNCDLRKRDPLGVRVAVDVVAKRGFDVRVSQNLLHGFGRYLAVGQGRSQPMPECMQPHILRR